MLVELDGYGFANGIILKEPHKFKSEVKKWQRQHPNDILKFKKLKLYKEKTNCHHLTYVEVPDGRGYGESD